jgi:tetratricopeptide (TPR) repeat protein
MVGAGVRREAKGELDNAIADYTEAIKFDPTYDEAYFSRGRARHKKGDDEGAIADYTKTIQLSPLQMT